MALSKININTCEYELSYEIINPNISSTILILHGWGANKELMKQAFKDTLEDLKQIYLDLPGFGKSSIVHPLSTHDYALIVNEFLKKNDLVPNIFMGHSFGGKICTLLSMNFPKSLLVLLSSAGIIWKKSLKIRSKIALFRFFKKIGFQNFRSLFVSKDVAGMNEVMYGTFKKVVDEDFSEIFSTIENKTLIFWGKEDTATPLKSGKKIHILIKKSEFYPLCGDHFFFLKNASFIVDKLKNFKELK